MELIPDVRALVSLQDEWRELARGCIASSIFQRPEWLLPWWSYSGSGQMWTLAFRDSGNLVGLLPMFLHEWDYRRQVTLIGNGISDHLDIIAEPQFALGCAEHAYDYLQNHSSEWDVCDWQDLPENSVLLQAGHNGFQSSVSDSIPCAAIALPATYESFFENLPHGLRRNVHRYGEHVRKDHQVRFQTVASDPDGNLVTALIRLHGARWQTKGEPGMLAGRERFFRTVTPGLAAANLLRIHILEADQETVGIIYQLRHGETAYGYITGFDPAFDRYSPGVLLLDYAISRAIEEGARCWDFLRGEELYKFQWGAVPSSKFRLRLWSGSREFPESERVEQPEVA